MYGIMPEENTVQPYIWHYAGGEKCPDVCLALCQRRKLSRCMYGIMLKEKNVQSRMYSIMPEEKMFQLYVWHFAGVENCPAVCIELCQRKKLFSRMYGIMPEEKTIQPYV